MMKDMKKKSLISEEKNKAYDSDISEIKSTIEEEKAKLSELQKKKSTIFKIMSKNNTELSMSLIDATIDKLTTRQMLELSTITTKSDKMKTIKANIKLFESLYSEFIKKQEELNVLTILEEMTSVNGISVDIIKTKLQMISTVINIFFKEFMKKEVELCIRSEEEIIDKDSESDSSLKQTVLNKITKNKKVPNMKSLLKCNEKGTTSGNIKIYIKIRDLINKTEYKNHMGGCETFFFEFLFRISLILMCKTPIVNLFFIDESMSCMDEVKIEEFSKVLGYIQYFFNKIILISHIDYIKTICSNVITISQKNGRSIVNF